MVHRLLVGLLCGLGLLVCACASAPPLLRPSQPIPVEWADQAARGGLAVLSVAPWDEYVAALQPEFQLTAEQARSQAIPITMRQEAEMLDALASTLKVALPTTSTTSSSGFDRSASAGTQTSSQATNMTVNTDTSATGAAPVSSQTSTQNATNTSGSSGSTSSTSTSSSSTTRQPGDVSKVTLPASPDLPPALRPSVSPIEGAIDRDPMTTYAAGTALYQEVQLLNRYVKDAALRNKRSAYVIRLQVSVLPQLRGQAYDAYTMISFSYAPKDSTPVLIPYAARKLPPGADQLNPSEEPQPIVIPLLVTDSLEQSAAATSASRLRGFALALAAMPAGVGLSGDLARKIQSLQAVVGEDSNSLLTVTKVFQNVLRVRFGAINQVGTGLALQPRNHEVTALVLVPDNFDRGRQVDVLSKLELVRATDGVTLPDRPFKDTKEQIHTVVCSYIGGCKHLTGDQQEDADTLAYAVQDASRPARFEEEMKKLQIDPASKSRLSMDLLDIMSKGPSVSTSFEVPDKAPGISAEGQVVTAIDDGASTLASIRNVRNIGTGEVAVALQFTSKDLQRLSILATSVAMSGTTLTATFPSLQKLKVCERSGDCTQLTTELYWTAPTTRWDRVPAVTPIAFDTTRLVTVPKSDDKPATPFFTVQAGARQIIATAGGTGTLRVTFVPADKHADESMFFTVEGADIAQVGPDTIKLGSKGWHVPTDAQGSAVPVTLSLTNLSEEADVRLTPSNGDATRDALVFRVRRTKSAKDLAGGSR